jgi:SPP1 gp7 family putative phage head morphogenesis protein
LQGQIDAGILSVDATGKPWTAQYVTSAHKQGLVRAYVDTRPRAAAKSMDFYQGSKKEFLRSAFMQPEMLSKIELLSTRAFEDLKDVTTTMSAQMNRILSDGLSHGESPEAISRKMSKQIGKLNRTRARTIARTEIINAHAEGQLDGFEELGVKELGLRAEWSTAGDDVVCLQCLAMEGRIFTVKQARGLIPYHPNCRCAWIPVTGKMKKRLKSVEPKQLDVWKSKAFARQPKYVNPFDEINRKLKKAKKAAKKTVTKKKVIKKTAVKKVAKKKYVNPYDELNDQLKKERALAKKQTDKITKPKGKTPAQRRAELDKATSVEDVEDWCFRQFPDTDFDLAGMHVDSARATAKQYHRMAMEYPDIAKDIEYVGSYRTRTPKSLTKLNKSAGKGFTPFKFDNEYAHASRYGVPVRDAVGGHVIEGGRLVMVEKGHIGLNPDWYGNPTAYKASLTSGQIPMPKESFIPKVQWGSTWHPAGCDSIESVMTHEFGHHVLTHYMRATNKAFYDIVQADGFGNIGETVLSWSRMNRATVKLSRYARTNMQEQFAEGFTFIYHGTGRTPAFVNRQKALLKLLSDESKWVDMTQVRYLHGLSQEEIATARGYLEKIKTQINYTR